MHFSMQPSGCGIIAVCIYLRVCVGDGRWACFGDCVLLETLCVCSLWDAWNDSVWGLLLDPRGNRWCLLSDFGVICPFKWKSSIAHGAELPIQYSLSIMRKRVQNDLVTCKNCRKLGLQTPIPPLDSSSIFLGS